tara:strand:+ start:271 stop:633 length:363 start_codon:yes stop_codon:yes gene_type:complete
MLKKGDKVIWNAGKVMGRQALDGPPGSVYAIVTDITLVDDPLIKDWKPTYPKLQRLERVAWRLVRKGWVICVVSPLDHPNPGTFFARGRDIDPLPIDKQESIKKWEETTESLIRNEMVEE